MPTIKRIRCSLITLFASMALVVLFAEAASAGFVYALNQVSGGANQIYGFNLNPSTGALTLLPGFPVASGGLGGSDSISGLSEHVFYRNGRLFVVNSGSPSLSVFFVSSTGALTAAPFSPIALSGNLACVTANPTAGIVAIGSDDGMFTIAITPTTATIAPGSPFATDGAEAFSCTFSNDGNYVYTGGNVGAVIAGFSVAPSTGVLTPLAGSPFDTGAISPVGYATDTAGRFFTSNFGGGVQVFTSSSGVLTGVTGNPFTSGLTGGVQGIVSPFGYYMVADRANNQVGVFRITGSGAATTLTAVAGSPFSSGGTFTDAITQTSNGGHVVAANGFTRNLTVFQVNGSTGLLTSLGTQPVNSLGASGHVTGIAFAAPGGFGDSDGSGTGDLLLRNGSNGQNIGWLMNGLTVSISAFLPTIADTNWEIRGRGDFNADGKADVVLRNRSTGQNIGWLMNGLTVSNSAFLPTIADTNWQIRAAGDFDGDGKGDIVLRNGSTGQNIGWLMNGLAVGVAAFLPTIADTNWEIQGAGDFDGNGKADLIWRNRSTGQNIGWLMNGLTVSTFAFLSTIADTNWQMKGVGDFNGDGNADVAWRHRTTGQNIGWLMNGLVVSTAAFLPTIADTNWEIKGSGDFDGNGRSDIILRNRSTGQNIGWLMNGLAVSVSAFMPTIADTNWDFVGQGQAF